MAAEMPTAETTNAVRRPHKRTESGGGSVGAEAWGSSQVLRRTNCWDHEDWRFQAAVFVEDGGKGGRERRWEEKHGLVLMFFLREKCS